MRAILFIYLINSFNPIDFGKKEKTKKKTGQSVRESSHFKLKICISCLCDTVCICGQIFVKLEQFVYIINSLNPIDFEKYRTISKGNVAILS